LSRLVLEPDTGPGTARLNFGVAHNLRDRPQLLREKLGMLQFVLLATFLPAVVNHSGKSGEIECWASARSLQKFIGTSLANALAGHQRMSAFCKRRVHG
jgi:hypothetical protein